MNPDLPPRTMAAAPPSHTTSPTAPGLPWSGPERRMATTTARLLAPPRPPNPNHPRTNQARRTPRCPRLSPLPPTLPSRSKPPSSWRTTPQTTPHLRLPQPTPTKTTTTPYRPPSLAPTTTIPGSPTPSPQLQPRAQPSSHPRQTPISSSLPPRQSKASSRLQAASSHRGAGNSSTTVLTMHVWLLPDKTRPPANIPGYQRRRMMPKLSLTMTKMTQRSTRFLMV